MNSKLAILSSLFIAQAVSAAETATLEGWPSGDFSIDCPFTYEIEPKVEWGRTGDPPLTLSELNRVFDEFSENRYPNKEVSIGSYHLTYNNFMLGGDVGWIYFINYVIREPGIRSVDGFDGSIGRALVTMGGTVIEVSCDAQ